MAPITYNEATGRDLPEIRNKIYTHFLNDACNKRWESCETHV
jgi:hypothetical protein